MNILRYVVALVILSATVSSCAYLLPAIDAGTPCETASFTVSDDFAGARRGTCSIISANHVLLTIRPEDEGYINDSPWYAFRISPKIAGDAIISLRYRGGHHRYVPKLSVDGVVWQPIKADKVSRSGLGRRTKITIPLGDDAVWVSGQELLTPAIYDAWNRARAASDSVALTTLGKSRAGRPIELLTTGAKSDDVLLLVGRQHPPEVSGAIGFFAFYETLSGDSELARLFRERFQITAIPLLNPDGVAAGHWRNNLGGTDLNRDWGPFQQPETQLVQGLMDSLDAEGKKIRMFLDFHSTANNLFYTQDEDNETTPPRFAYFWLANARQRLTNYPFEYHENPTDALGVGKNYIYHRYGIPAVTYEVGDETNRQDARAAAQVFAEELMKLMLEQTY